MAYSVHTGWAFIGFGPLQTCGKCQKQAHVEILQSFQQYRPYFLPILPRIHYSFSVVCGECGGAFVIRKRDKVRVAMMLEKGYSMTKEYYERLEPAQKQILLNNLHRNGFYELEGRLQQ